MVKAGEERRKIFMEKLFKEEYTVDPEHLYKPRSGDVIVVGSPKSGTTWLQQICHQIRTKGDTSFDDIYNVTSYIVHPSWQVYDVNGEQMCNPRIFKHHEPYGVLKTTNEQKHIVITRNPYDTTFSNIKFMDRWYGGDKDVEEHQMVEIMEAMHKNKKLSHFEVLCTWWPHRHDPNTILLFYEDAVADLKSFINIVANFMDIALSADELEKVAHYCSFEWMQKNEQKFFNSRMAEKRAMALGMESWQPKSSCVRKDGGQVGQGKRELGAELKSMVDKLWSDTMVKMHNVQSYEELYRQYGLFNKK